MHERNLTIPSVLLMVVLVSLFYPVFFLGRVVAPEAGMRGVPPWRGAWGPYPHPSAYAAAAATDLGPRLALISREGSHGAIWNRWIGGGRGGWLSSAREGGAPLPVVAATIARPQREWTALVALEVGLALLLAWIALSRLGYPDWAAAAGALTFALAGPCSTHWLDWQASAMALGPLALIVADSRRPSRRAAALAGLAVVLLLSAGLPAVQFLVLGLAAFAFAHRHSVRSCVAVAPFVVSTVLAGMVLLPRLWLWWSSAEPGATFAGLSTPPPLPGLRALIDPHPLGDPSMVALAGGILTPPGAAFESEGYLGVIAVVVALIGLSAGHVRERALWGGSALAAAILCLAPVPGIFPFPFRPAGALALATAVLVAIGVAAIGTRLGRPHLTGPVIIALLFLDLFPTAAHRLPVASATLEDLPRPFTAESLPRGARVAALGATLPPDIGATLELADIRAADLSREPRYASKLGLSPQATLPFQRALDPVLARLGTRFLIEPLPLEVVSGIVFSGTSFASAEGRWSPPDRLILAVDVPPGATRVAIPAALGSGVSASLATDTGRRQLLRLDPALAGESDAWTWFSMPQKWPVGPASLVVMPSAQPTPPAGVLWDASGLRLRGEGRGARIWESDRARPLAFLAAGIVSPESTRAAEDAAALWVTVEPVAGLGTMEGAHAEETVRAVRLAITHLVFEAHTTASRLLVAQIKFRPGLWRVTVNGTSSDQIRIDDVWTGVVVPPGQSTVHFAAAVPKTVSVASLTALLVLLAFAVPGVRR